MPRSTPSAQGNSLETQATLHLLSDVERDSFLSQRRFSMRFGIAVGLTNAYVKRCIKKGWIKMSRVPARRYAYYLTPKGFSEKSRLVANYLYGSLDFFRTARRQCVEALHECERQGWRHVALAGDSELCCAPFFGPRFKPAFPKYRRYSVRREGDSAIRIIKL